MATRKPRKAYVPSTPLINKQTGVANQVLHRLISTLTRNTQDSYSDSIYSWLKPVKCATLANLTG